MVKIVIVLSIETCLAMCSAGVWVFGVNVAREEAYDISIRYEHS